MAQSATRTKTQTFSNDNITLSTNATVWGDSETLTSGMVGGNDTFYGRNGASGSDGNSALGDSSYMYGTAKGGADTFYGGVESNNYFVGDAGSMTDSSLGGADRLIGGTDGYNFLSGDAYSMDLSAKGGSDNLVGGNAVAQNAGYGYESASNSYGTWVDEGYATNLMMGDAYVMGGTSQGGQDTMVGGSVTGAEDDGFGDTWVSTDSVGGGYWEDTLSTVQNFMMGDAFALVEGAIGNIDNMTGGNATGQDAQALNLMAGDAFLMGDTARAANDILIGGNANSGTAGDGYGIDGGAVVFNLMSGDTFYQEQGSLVAFGSDVLRGGSGAAGTDSYALNIMFGDVGTDLGGSFFGASTLTTLNTDSGILSAVKGGNDMLYGGLNDAYNMMVGDAFQITGGGSGGFDTITGGGANSFNLMVGDAIYMDAGTVGGNDKLISGAGDDDMWGDAIYNSGIGGADTFVFASANGSDTVEDFHLAEGDKLNLSAFKRLDADFSSVSKLLSSGRVTTDGGDLIIDTDLAGQDGNEITIVGGASLLDAGATWLII